jgi:hypothetical protein
MTSSEWAVNQLGRIDQVERVRRDPPDQCSITDAASGIVEIRLVEREKALDRVHQDPADRVILAEYDQVSRFLRRSSGGKRQEMAEVQEGEDLSSPGGEAEDGWRGARQAGDIGAAEHLLYVP